jgi:hypothetical protein
VDLGNNTPGLLLVSKLSQLPTIGAGPGDGITGHAPQVIFHAVCTNFKTATTNPAKREFLVAHMTQVLFFSSAFPPVGSFRLLFFHVAIPCELVFHI